MCRNQHQRVCIVIITAGGNVLSHSRLHADIIILLPQRSVSSMEVHICAVYLIAWHNVQKTSYFP